MATNTNNYSLAGIASLTETERTRLIIMLLHNRDRNNMDWDAATALSGAKTKHAFQVSYYNAMKKLNNGADGGGTGSKASTPKRKRAADGDGSPTPTPTPKKRGRVKKAAKTEEEEPELQPDGDVEAKDAASEEEPELEFESFFNIEEI